MRSYPQAEAPSIDQVTLLPDRRRLLELLAEALQSSGGSVAVLLVDIDGFRKINRDRGHDIGDELLFSSGRRIRSAVGADDIVARADRFHNQIVIAAHFSTRYHGKQVHQMVRQKLPDMLGDRLHLWI